MKDARVGVNLPPMHPFCRSTTIAVTKSSDELDRRTAELTDSTGTDEDFNTWRNSLQKLPNGEYQYVKPIDISDGSGIIINMQFFGNSRLSLKLPKNEYGKIIHEINTLYSSKYEGLRTFVHYSGNYKYIVESCGFDKYKIITKVRLK